MPSASNSCEREKVASAILDLASASACVSGSAPKLSNTRPTSATWRARSSRIAAWLRDHVRHLVRQHRGEFGGVVGERDQAAGHVEIPARQREGIDRGGIENGDAVALVGPLRGGDELLDRAVDHGVELRVLIGAVVGRQDALMLALGRRRRRGALRRRIGEIDLPGRAGRVRREAAAEQQAERDGDRRRKAAGSPCLVALCLHGRLQFASTSSICSGRLASIRGPLRTSIQPRTRKRLFSSAFGASPAPVKMRS